MRPKRRYLLVELGGRIEPVRHALAAVDRLGARVPPKIVWASEDGRYTIVICENQAVTLLRAALPADATVLRVSGMIHHLRAFLAESKRVNCEPP